MATGANDANGIYQYGSDDPRAPFHDTLNLGQQSVSVAVGLLKARALALENANALGSVGSPFVAASGWTLGQNQGRKKNGMAFTRVQVARSGSAITVPSDGDIATQILATFAAGWAPAAGMLYPAVATSLAHIGVCDSSGVQLTAVAPGITLPNGAVVSFALIYPLG